MESFNSKHQFVLSKATNSYHVTIQDNKDFRILQLTDLHLGCTLWSKRKDNLALNAISTLIQRTNPDLLVLTGDSIFPFLPKSGTLNNKKQITFLCNFLSQFNLPYALVFGNHDIELGAFYSKEQISSILESEKNCLFLKGKDNLTGCGNYSICISNESKTIDTQLIMLDSNMYPNGWFYSGFDCVHKDQIDWCIKQSDYAKQNLVFLHMPIPEFKSAYEQMKLGNKQIQYISGSIGEKNDYFGISKYNNGLFDACLSNGKIKGIFCGHDHLNTLSLNYKGIQLTYGMSIDFLGYKNIEKYTSQRGGTLITLNSNGSFSTTLIPLTSVVSPFVRGA